MRANRRTRKTLGKLWGLACVTIAAGLVLAAGCGKESDETSAGPGGAVPPPEVPIPIAEASPEGNAWNDYVAAVGLVTDDNPIAKAYFQPTRLNNDLGAAIEPNKAALEKAREGVGKPCEMPELVRYGPSGIATGGFKALAILLILDGRRSEKADDADKALASYEDAITMGRQLVSSSSGVPLKIGRFAIEAGCTEASALLRGNTSVAEDNLRQLIQLSKDTESDLPTLSTVVSRERQSVDDWLVYALPSLDKGSLDLIEGLPIGYQPDPQAVREQVDQAFDQAEALAEQPLQSVLEAEVFRPSDPLASRCCEDIRGVAFQTARVRAYLRAARIIAAVGLYPEGPPENLEDLVPDYLDRVPTDPISGGPFAWRTTDSGFDLYSIGLDGKDDELSLHAVGPQGEGDIPF